MARLSPTKRRMARQRRGASLQRQEYKGTVAQMREYIKAVETRHQQMTVTVLALLTQNGGSLTVTQGTTAQVLERLNMLSWSAKNSDDGGETVFQVVDTTPVEEEIHERPE